MTAQVIDGRAGARSLEEGPDAEVAVLRRESLIGLATGVLGGEDSSAADDRRLRR